MIGVIGSYFVVSKMFSLDFDLLFMFVAFYCSFLLFLFSVIDASKHKCAYGVGDHFYDIDK